MGVFIYFCVMSNKENFMKLVSDEKTDTITKNKDRIKNRSSIKESQKFALFVLMRLDELGWSQKDLASKMSTSLDEITKIVSGKEILTNEIKIKLQKILENA